MKIIYKTWVAALLIATGIFWATLYARAACNSPNGEVELVISGPTNVVAGTAVTFTMGIDLLSQNPGKPDLTGGVFIWDYAGVGFTAVGSTNGASITLVAPATPSTSVDDNTLSCQFSKTGWFSATECSAEKEIKVVSHICTNITLTLTQSQGQIINFAGETIEWVINNDAHSACLVTYATTIEGPAGFMDRNGTDATILLDTVLMGAYQCTIAASVDCDCTFTENSLTADAILFADVAINDVYKTAEFGAPATFTTQMVGDTTDGLIRWDCSGQTEEGTLNFAQTHTFNIDTAALGVGYHPVTLFVVYGADARVADSGMLHVWSGNEPPLNKDPKRPPIGVQESGGGLMWINDDNDASNDDVPGNSSGDNSDNVINGVRDLIDFSAVWVYLNVQSSFITDDYDYYLQASPADAVKVCQTGLNMNNWSNYLYDVPTAEALANSAVTQGDNVTTGSLFKIEGDSLASLLDTSTSNSTLFLVEGVARGDVEFKFLIKEKSGDNTFMSDSFSIEYDSVEEMYWQTSLYGENTITTDAPLSSPPVSDDNICIFVHGYNVNKEQARGWYSEMFKRLRRAGMTAEFHGISWPGYDSQIPVVNIAPNYHVNVLNAFAEAQSLALYVDQLEGRKCIMAHSLGNIVVSSAIAEHGMAVDDYMILNGAVARECYDAGAGKEWNMRNDLWDDLFIDNDQGASAVRDDLFASEWYKLFRYDASDERSELTWRGIFSDMGATKVHNFYSAGDKIVRSAAHASADNLASAILYPWTGQEKLKGRMVTGAGWLVGSTWGGWGKNAKYKHGWCGGCAFPPAQCDCPSHDEWVYPFDDIATAFYGLSSFQFTEEPLFKKVPATLFASGLTGSNYALANRKEILARAIPATTFSVGSSPISLDDNFTDYNLETEAFWTEWPGGWNHSDIKNVPFVYQHKLFKKLVSEGGL